MDFLSREDHILKVSNEIDNYQDEELILAILNITSDEYINTILKFKGYGSKKLCANAIEESEIFYQCFDCCKDNYHVICNQCFIPEIHKGHAVFFEEIQTEMSGYCDCGDTSIFDTKLICPQHHQFEVKFQNEQLDDKVVSNYEQFLMIAFGILQKKLEQIVDYPVDLLENIENIIECLNNDVLKNYFNTHKIHFQSIQNSMNQAKQINSLILKCLEIITKDNIMWGCLTGKILRQEFKLKIDDNVIGSTSLLECYIKYNAHLVGSLGFEQDISTFFPLLFQEDEFRAQLTKTITQNFQSLYLLINSYKLITTNNEEFKFQIYQRIYDEKLSVLIKQILSCSQIKQIICENILIKGTITEKFFVFIQRGYLEILQLYQEVKTPKFYNVFNIISNLLLEINLIDQASMQLADSICYFLEWMSKYKQGVKELVNQIQEILSTDFHFFKSQILNSNSLQFQKILNQSLLVYSLTRRNPCQQKTDFNLEYHIGEEQGPALNFLLILVIQNLSLFRSDFRSFILEVGHLRSYEVQNIQRIILHYFLNNLVTTFNLQHQSLRELIITNLVLSDRNFITVLSIYLMNFSNSKEAYDDILQISGYNNEQFRLIMGFILKRAILNYTILSEYIYYLGKQTFFEDLNDEVTIQQVDIAYIQIYAYLFQEQGIYDIVQFYNEISQHLKQKGNLALLICRIAQTDNDLIQCVGNTIGNELNVQFQKGYSKLFQTIFYSQTFYQLNEMKNVLKQFTNQNYKNFETVILGSCEMNKDNGQFQLKKQFKLPIYEPVYAFQNEEIHEKINDKLYMQNDKFAELFGSSLEYELQYYNTDQSKSTLTNIRFGILKAISLDDQQYLLLEILTDLENTFSSKMEFDIIVDKFIKILQDNAIYLNLLYLSNQFFKTSNAIIQDRLDKIKYYCQVILLSQKVNYTQKLFFEVYCQRLESQSSTQKLNEVNHKQQSMTEKQQQYKQQLQQKFHQMKDNFNIKINNVQLTDDSEERCLLCKLPFKKSDLQYQPILIQYSNIYQYLNILKQQPTSEINILSVHVSNCNHNFHAECLIQQIQSSKEKDQKFEQCPICYSPYNFMLPNSYQMQNIEILQFELSIDAFLESLINNNQEIFQKKFLNTELNIHLILNQILSQILCNLTFQILSDIETFSKKNQHLFIQKIIDLMRFLYKQLNTNLIDTIKISETEILFQILQLIQTHLIKEYNMYNFQQNLSILLNPNFELAKTIFELFTQKKINTQIDNRLLPYDIQRIKDSFKQERINFLTNNFSSFLQQNYLRPCQKKKCQFPKIKMETKFQGQYLCLVCLKKMCPEYCGRVKQQDLGNLQRHSNKKHLGKCVYLSYENSQLLLICSPSYMFMPNTLYTDKIGDSPIKGPYPSQHYKKFQINIKILDQIFEIIMEEKYLNKLDQDQNDV